MSMLMTMPREEQQGASDLIPPRGAPHQSCLPLLLQSIDGEVKMPETVEPDGHLPGFKDGVGVFPPGSDWAEVMLALKLKGMV